VDGGQLVDHGGDDRRRRGVGVDDRGGVGVLIDELVEGELAGRDELPFDRGAVQVLDADEFRGEGVVGMAGRRDRQQVAGPDAEVA
jgi:hypothetical protein